MKYWIALMFTGALTACDIRGGSQSVLLQPSIVVAGAETTYWQDEEVRITFAASNMDATTVEFSIDNLTQELADGDFYFDSTAGFLTDNPDSHMKAKDYSLLVSATDASGSTASTTLSFTVDLVPTTLKVWSADIRGINEADAISEDGPIIEDDPISEDDPLGRAILAIARSGDLSFRFWNGGPRGEALRFVCFGDAQTNADDLSASGQCNGLINNLSTQVARFETDGYKFDFYDDAGLALGYIIGAPTALVGDRRLDNSDIPGVYYFYDQDAPAPLDGYGGSWNSSAPYDMALLKITDSFTIESLPSYNELTGQRSNTVGDCQYKGEIDQASIDEGFLTTRNSDLLSDQDRVLSGEMSLECELAEGHPIVQKDGRFVAYTYASTFRDREIQYLRIAGGGEMAHDAPLWRIELAKVCNRDGSPGGFAGARIGDTVCPLLFE